MWRRSRVWGGRALIAVALVALPAKTIISSYVGGSASYGSIEDEHYFVGGHGRHLEVSETAWYVELWVSRPFWLAVWVPGLAGLFLLTGGQSQPVAPPRPLAPADLVLWHYVAGIGICFAGAWLGWVIGRVPWTILLGGWLGLYAACALVIWLQWRHARHAILAEPAPAPGNAGGK